MFFVPSYFRKKSKESNASRRSECCSESNSNSQSKSQSQSNRSSSSSSISSDDASVGRIKTSVIVELPVPSLRVVPIQSFCTITTTPSSEILEQQQQQPKQQQQQQQENGENMGRLFCGAGDTAFELSLLKRHYSSDGRVAKFHTPLPPPPPTTTTTSTTTSTVVRRKPLSKATTTTTTTTTTATREEEEFQQRVQESEFWNEAIEFVAAELANVPETLTDVVREASRKSGSSKSEKVAFDHAVMDLMLMS
jgi:hypothetical protein